MISTSVLLSGRRTRQDDVADLFHRLRTTAGRLPGFARVPDWVHTDHPGTGFPDVDAPLFGHYRFEFVGEHGQARPADGMPVRARAVYRADGAAVLDGELDEPAHLIRVDLDYGRFDLHGLLVTETGAWAQRHGLAWIWGDDYRAWTPGPWTSHPRH